MKAGRADSSATGAFCLTIIGIGYLFPIAAIWAVFDYWKSIFPDKNVEYAVTLVNQLGSVTTVAILSFIKSSGFSFRIVGGFSGQLVSLAVILCFRWFHLPNDQLYDLLLFIVAFCSISTGFLDSALFSLCSQYSSVMQGYLQLGIGFGTFVSVVYRDVTKLLFATDINGSTSLFFVIALLTICFCIVCYFKLMSLPESRHIGGQSSGNNSLLTPERRFITPPASPMAAAYAYSVCQQPEQDGLTLDDRFSTKQADDSMRGVFKLVWKNHLYIFLNMFLTTLCYPGLITSIPCKQMHWLEDGNWFQTLLLTAFTLADIISRFFTGVRCGLYWRNVGWTVVFRSVLFPLMLFCVMSSAAGDTLSFVVVLLFGWCNGFCVSLCLIVVHEIPGLTDEQKVTSGRIAACSVNLGLCLGSVFAALVGSVLGLDG
eukprot:TRINITY_DN67010_c0_g1_i1.p1 TRINITY_DN67010_c0_g1~~TRINITY_DN67010_c0_g1_i1.p1  ORF type:complete len:463 (-),score=48.02 TRINITY_DN67010_c0_g1_i1:83-1369(-)